jgi:hypothetical protein
VLEEYSLLLVLLPAKAVHRRENIITGPRLRSRISGIMLHKEGLSCNVRSAAGIVLLKYHRSALTDETSVVACTGLIGQDARWGCIPLIPVPGHGPVKSKVDPHHATNVPGTTARAVKSGTW